MGAIYHNCQYLRLISGGKGENMKRTCENCILSQDCKTKGRICSKHRSVSEKITDRFRESEWEKFCEEWNKAVDCIKRRRYGRIEEI